MNKEIINSNQSGRSMIEMLGVLAIVGVLSVGGIAGYSKAMTKFKINKTADQISQIVTNIRTLYAQQTTYAGLNTANAIKMGVTPDELGTGTTLTHSFAGSITISTNNRLTNSSSDAFEVTISNLPMEACVTLATMDWGSSHSSGLIGIAVTTNGGGFDGYLDSCTSISSVSGSSGVRACSKDGPLSVVAATSGCKYAIEDRDKTIHWKFY